MSRDDSWRIEVRAQYTDRVVGHQSVGAGFFSYGPGANFGRDVTEQEAIDKARAYVAGKRKNKAFRYVLVRVHHTEEVVE